MTANKKKIMDKLKTFIPFLYNLTTYLCHTIIKHTMTNCRTLAELYRESTAKFSNLTMSRTSDGAFSLTYGEFRNSCEALSERLSDLGIGEGEKIAILSAGHPNWAVAFFAATAFGRVAVPILQEFTENEVSNVLIHSDARVLFVSRRCYKKVSQEMRERLTLIIELDSMETLVENHGEQTVNCGSGTQVAGTSEVRPEDLAVLIYTSGTTGTAKGVMLTHRNFIGNLNNCYDIHTIGPRDVMLSVLPLAHVYELGLGMIYPFASGSSVVYMSKPPTPTYLMKVLREVQPTAMLIVPLIIEKVFNSVIWPRIRKSAILTWMNLHSHRLLCRIIGRQLKKAFGGKLEFMGIGGAKPDETVEAFLRDARFPYRIGYGLTETCPLLSYSCYKNTIPGSIGWPCKNVQLRLDNVNPLTGEGEIVAKGDNVFPGYYKDPERTAAAFTKDGWFKTNDLAARDAAGRYYIKGRLNNMILSASGENIYPEEIEKVFNQLPEVEEAIVIERSGKLVALVKTVDNLIDMTHANDESVKNRINELKEKMGSYVNSRVKSSSKVNEIGIMKEPFDKTATMKIRRFKYKDEAPAI